MKYANLFASLLVLVFCKSVALGDEPIGAKKKSAPVVALENKILAIRRMERLGPAPGIADTAHFKKARALHEQINEAYKLNDWPNYTDACLELALLEHTLGQEGINAVHGFSNQKRFEEAEYLLNELSNASSPSNHTYFRVEEAKLYEAEGRDSDAEEILKTLAIGGHINREAQQAYKSFLQRHGRTIDVNNIVALMNDRHCPVCKSDLDVVPIGYGLTPAGMPSSADEKVHPGGCCYSAGSPTFWCKKDKVGF